MKRIRSMAALLLIATWITPAAVFCENQPALGKNIEAILQQILANQEKMSEDIRLLRQKITDQDQEISSLKQQIQQQSAAVVDQQKRLDEQSKVIQERPAVSDEPTALQVLASRDQFTVARDLQHHTIFNVRRGEQKEWFERVVVEFRKIVDQYPKAPEAHDAQIRIARTYHRYLNDPQQAIKEYQKLVDNYPDSPYVQEARERIAQLSGR